jgi:hypothetical protein
LAGAVANSLPPFEPLPTPKTKTHHPTAIDQNHIEREEPKDAYPPKQSIHHSQQQEEEGAITLSFTPSKKLKTKWHQLKAQNKMASIPLTHP